MKFFSLLSAFCFCLLAHYTGFGQYCTTGLYSTFGCTDNDYIQSFSTTGGISNITNNGSGCNGGTAGYTLFGMTHMTVQGQTVNWSLTNTPSWSEGYKIWVDFNADGDFIDAGEEVYVSSPILVAGGSASGSFVVPMTAFPGLTRLRVRCVFNNANFTSCGSYTFGEVEDYPFQIVAATPCSGTPVAGSTYGPSIVCPGLAFSLIDTGFSANGAMTYQWESSVSGANSWSAVPGANTPASYIAGGISIPTDFRFVVSCTNGNLSDTSNVITVDTKPFYECYCGPATGAHLNFSAINRLTNVTITGTTLNNSSTSTSSQGYSLYSPSVPSSTATLTPGVQYYLNTTHGNVNCQSSAWIDYDHSGVFDSSEFVPLTTAGVGASGAFTVPTNAIPGLTGIRVRNYVAAFSASGACLSFSDYETEDYVVTIASLSACSATPGAGTAFGPTNVCQNAKFYLVDTGYSTGSGITYQWEASAAGANNWIAIPGAVYPTYLVAGGITTAKDYRMTVSCANSGQSTISNVISVNPSIVFNPVIAAGGPLTVCSGSSVSLTASGGNSYSWNTGSSSSFIYANSTGTYTVTVTNNSGCVGTASKTVTVKPMPNPIKITANATSACYPDDVHFYIDLPAGSVTGFNYQWKLNGAIISGATDSVYAAPVNGSYTLTVSGSGCSKTSAAKTAKIKPNPTASIVPGGSTAFCEGGMVNLQGSTGSGYTYKWYRDGMNIASTASVNVKVNGSYVLITKLNGCSDTSASLPVTVYPSPSSSVSSSDPLTFCIGSSALLQASPSGSGYAYQWYKGTNSLAGATIANYLSSVTGSYKVQVTDNNGCTKLSSGVTTTQKPLPTATITALGPTSFPTGGNVTLRASNGTGYTWKWYKNGTIISGATTRDYVATAAGDYTVKVTKGSCSAISAIKTVSTTSPKTPLSNSMVAEDGFQLVAYPNPVNTELTIGVKGMDQVKGLLQLLDVNGKLIMSKQMNGVTEAIDMSSFTPGVYLLRYSDGIHTESLRVVKQ